MTDQLALGIGSYVPVRDAVISDCGRYRYRLEERWAPGPATLWIMLNPSTADAKVDDPTIRRVRGFTRAFGAPGFVVVNLYALRSPSPKDLRRAADPVGPLNDDTIRRELAACADVVAAWGSAHHNAPCFANRVAFAREAAGPGRLRCLATTDDGAPRHPLYLRAELRPIPWA